MKFLQTVAWTVVAGASLAAGARSQLCAIPCNGTQVNCTNQNGIRNHRGGPAVAKAGPNAATGNVLGDAEWKIWACENGGTRGSGVATITNWEIGVVNNQPSQLVTATFTIPSCELRPVLLSAAGVKEPVLAAPPLAAFTVGTIAVPTGGFRINVSILTPTVAPPASCPAPTGLPTLPNGDFAMLILYTPGEVLGPTYYRNFQPTTEVNTISNPSVPPAPPGANSYSGSVDALLGAVTHSALASELYAEAGFYDPTLEVLRLTTGFTLATTGSGARELLAGDSVVFRSKDWEAGKRAFAGEDRLAAVLLSDSSAGSPLCLAPPGTGPGFLAGSLFFPGSAGVLALYPTATTTAFLGPFTATLGVGLNCHVTGFLPCWVGTDLRADTAPIVVPPGLTGSLVYAAAFYVNLTTLTIDDGSNTVELLFL